MNEERIKIAIVKGPLIKNMRDVDLRLELANVINFAYSLRSKVASIDESNFVVDIMIDELKTNYSFLALGEIIIAVKSWLYEQSGNSYFGMAPADFVRSLEHYIRGDARKSIVKQLYVSTKQTELSQEQMDMLNQNALKSTYNRFYNDVKECGHICDLTNIFVDWFFNEMISSKQIVLTKEQEDKLAKDKESWVKREILNNYFAEIIKKEQASSETN